MTGVGWIMQALFGIVLAITTTAAEPTSDHYATGTKSTSTVNSELNVIPTERQHNR